MFKNRHFEVKLVKDAQSQPTTVEETKPSIDIEEISRHAKELGKQLIIGSLIVIGSTIALSTLSQIAVNACDNTDKKEEN